MKRKWANKRITINLSEQEGQILEEYCSEKERTATDVVRELIRGLAKKSEE
jgi:hypothetical protein